jgi:hypothetical protein
LCKRAAAGERHPNSGQGCFVQKIHDKNWKCFKSVECWSKPGIKVINEQQKAAPRNAGFSTDAR